MYAVPTAPMRNVRSASVTVLCMLVSRPRARNGIANHYGSTAAQTHAFSLCCVSRELVRNDNRFPDTRAQFSKEARANHIDLISLQSLSTG